MITISEAWLQLLPHLQPLPTTTVPRRKAAGRTLSAPIAATVDVPFADVSAMDGYALGGPVSPGDHRPVCATIAAGDPPGFELPAGAAARIMTGAPVPMSADRVVPVELTDAGDTDVCIRQTGEAGAHVRRRGEVVQRGQTVLEAGVELTPGALSLLATHGVETLPVIGSPRVGILVTGDEVVPPEQEPGPGQLRDSHTDFLLAAGARLGLHFEALGIAGDEEESIRGGISRGLEHDVLLLTGGVSMGEFDLVEGALEARGCALLFDSVAIQPGKPLVAAMHPGGPLIFGLPGNPASVMVAFWLFVAPALRRLMGSTEAEPLAGLVHATASDPQPAAKGRDRFLPCALAARRGVLFATTFPPRGSHDLVAFASGNALLRIPAGTPARPAGEPCEVLPLF